MQTCTDCKPNLLRKIKEKWQTVRYAWWGLRLIYAASPARTTFVFFIKMIDSILGPVLVWISAKVIEGLLQDHQVFLSFGPVFWMAILFVLLTILVDVLNPYVEMNKKLLTAQIQKHIDEQLMDKANSFEDIAPFDETGFHTKVKVVRYNEYFITLWLEMTASTFGGIVQIVASSILLWNVIAYVPLLFLLLALPRLFVEAKLNNATFEGREEVQELRRRAEYFMGLPLQHELANEIKLYRLTPYFTAKYKEMARQLIHQLSRDQKKWISHNLGWGVLEAVANGVVLILIVQKAMAGVLPVGELLVFIGALFQLREGVTELFGVFAIGAREMVNVSRIAQFLGANGSAPSGTAPFPGGYQTGYVLENVKFSYQDGRDVLQIDHLVLPEGKVTVLVGENGSGKSTLVKLLLRFYEPASGTIRFNGKALGDYDISAFRAHSTAVFQDFVRYEMSMKSNIGVGNLPALHEQSEIEKAAALGGADEVASRLRDRYDTEIGRLFGGVNLSGGEWQRIAMARACMRNNSAEILIFDEPTSALDPYIEHEIFSRLKAMAKNKTVIVVSHRLSTAKLADQVVLLHKGRVKEVGDHHTLLKQGGIYAELYQMQASKYV
ncbi:ABC transporter ATP-binding protein [Brevibacillus gelatini]